MQWITDRTPEEGELNKWGEAWVINGDHHPHVAIWDGEKWDLQSLGWCASHEVIKWKPVTYEETEE